MRFGETMCTDLKCRAHGELVKLRRDSAVLDSLRQSVGRGMAGLEQAVRNEAAEEAILDSDDWYAYLHQRDEK